MSIQRRQFLRSGLVWSAAVTAAACAAERAAPEEHGAPPPPPPSPPPKQRVLVLGGTRFIGPPIVESFLARGWDVTLFNRGRTNPELFPQCEKLRGDRDGDMTALEGREWEAVIDTWTDAPRHVRSAALLLRDHVGQYVFVSSLNAIADLSVRGLDESAAKTPLDPADENSTDNDHFGGRKARCEELVEELCPGKWTVARPGLIVGPRDGSDRFTYWPVRVARGGEVFAPGNGDDPTQFIDSRDLGDFVATLVERRTVGLFNVVGPAKELTMRGLLEACKRVSGSDATFTWVDTGFLLEQGVAPWTDMPAWLPSLDPGQAFWTMNVSKAIGAGLTFRPVDVTILDTLVWWETLPEERRAAIRRGLKPEREAELLAAWHQRGG